MKNGIVLLLFAAISFSANAFLLHWADYQSVAPGTLTHDYLNVDGSGIDIRVDWTIAGATNMLTGYPTNDIDGLGMGSGHWFANTTTGKTTVLISFSEPVPYAKLDLWEIDGIMTSAPSLTNYMDKARIKGWDKPYNLTGATHITPSNYDGGADLLFVEGPYSGIDSGLNIINGGGADIFDANPENHAWVEFEDATFQSFVIEFNSIGGNRGAVLGDLVFVPEPATMLLLALGSLMLRKR
ncbi:MAG: PEP-CTERM sorting domain-containing protein [Planctomycetaceae bacterium]|nr:PEP-CTERM sorting domain-containing protein [Planctomycetaceae bacterium]